MRYSSSTSSSRTCGFEKTSSQVSQRTNVNPPFVKSVRHSALPQAGQSTIRAYRSASIPVAGSTSAANSRSRAAKYRSRPVSVSRRHAASMPERSGHRPGRSVRRPRRVAVVPSLLRLLGRPVRAVLRTTGLDLVRYQVMLPGDREHDRFAVQASIDPLPDSVRKRFPFPAPPEGEQFLPPEPPNGRDLIEDLIRERGASVLLEIGSFLGGSALRWLRASPDIVVVAVDPWQDGWAGDYLAGLGYPDQRERLNASDGLFEMFLRNVQPFADRVVPVRATSPSGTRRARRARPAAGSRLHRCGQADRRPGDGERALAGGDSDRRRLGLQPRHNASDARNRDAVRRATATGGRCASRRRGSSPTSARR